MRKRCARGLAQWGTSLSRSDREPATGPACGRGVPPSTPLPRWYEGSTLVPGKGTSAPARMTTVGASAEVG